MHLKDIKTNKATISNSLVTAKYDLDLTEKRLIFSLISNINNDICKIKGKERDNLEEVRSDVYYELTARDYANFCNITYEKAKDELVIASEKLYKREVIYMNSAGRTVRTRWIGTLINYSIETHSIKISWATGIIPVISNLRTHFTSYTLQCLSTLPSIYSIRLYEIFKMRLDECKKNNLKIYLQVDELYNMFNLGDKYALFSNFMQRVIEEPIAAINRDVNCDLNVTFLDEQGKKMYKKLGKKVVGIYFIVNRRRNECRKI